MRKIILLFAVITFGCTRPLSSNEPLPAIPMPDTAVINPDTTQTKKTPEERRKMAGDWASPKQK